MNDRDYRTVSGKIFRICNHCKRLLLREKYFDKNSCCIGGYQYLCRECWSNASWKGAYIQNQKRKTKKCSGCGEIKPKEEFCKSSASKDGLQYYCKSCNKEYDRLHRPVKHRKLTKKPQEVKRDNGLGPSTPAPTAMLRLMDQLKESLQREAEYKAVLERLMAGMK